MNTFPSENFFNFPNLKLFRTFLKKPQIKQKKDIYRKNHFIQIIPILAVLKKSHVFLLKKTIFVYIQKILLLQSHSTAILQ